MDDAAPASREDLEALGAGALKRLAREHAVDVSGCVEKAHLVDALRKAQAPLPEDHPKRSKQATPSHTPKPSEEAMKESMPLFLDAMLRVSLVDVIAGYESRVTRTTSSRVKVSSLPALPATTNRGWSNTTGGVR